jgi:hypothetical protein
MDLLIYSVVVHMATFKVHPSYTYAMQSLSYKTYVDNGKDTLFIRVATSAGSATHLGNHLSGKLYLFG